MPKKSKPKQRTNWKQRALHCEEVIGVQNELAKAAEVRMSRYIYSAAEAIKRAESAEKHNALLLEEREQTSKAIHSLTHPPEHSCTETSHTFVGKRGILPEDGSMVFVSCECGAQESGRRIATNGSYHIGPFRKVILPSKQTRYGQFISWASDARRFKAWAKGIRQRKPREGTTRL